AGFSATSFSVGKPRETTNGQLPPPPSHTRHWLLKRRTRKSRTSSGDRSFFDISHVLRKFQALGFAVVLNRNYSRFFSFLDVDEACTANERLQRHHGFERSGHNHLKAKR